MNNSGCPTFKTILRNKMYVECTVKFFKDFLKPLVKNGFKKMHIQISKKIEDKNQVIKIISIHESTATLIYFNLHSNNFIKIQCDEGINVGVNILNFYKLLNVIKEDDSVFVLSDKNKKKLRLHIKETNKEFVLDVLNYELLKIPSMACESYISMSTYKFTEAYEKMCVDDSNFFTIENTGNKLIFTNDKEISISFQDEKSINNNHNTVKILLESRWLQTIIDYIHLTNHIELFLKQDFPLIIKYSIDDKINIFYALSPIY
jgi:proliferating cell nuclear antigen